jgi:hypothetical protein
MASVGFFSFSTIRRRDIAAYAVGRNATLYDVAIKQLAAETRIHPVHVRASQEFLEAFARNAVNVIHRLEMETMPPVKVDPFPSRREHRIKTPLAAAEERNAAHHDDTRREEVYAEAEIDTRQVERVARVAIHDSKTVYDTSVQDKDRAAETVITRSNKRPRREDWDGQPAAASSSSSSRRDERKLVGSVVSAPVPAQASSADEEAVGGTEVEEPDYDGDNHEPPSKDHLVPSTSAPPPSRSLPSAYPSVRSASRDRSDKRR